MHSAHQSSGVALLGMATDGQHDCKSPSGAWQGKARLVMLYGRTEIISAAHHVCLAGLGRLMAVSAQARLMTVCCIMLRRQL